ncbi:MAG: fibronectin type III domain-containing protein, partial [Candidatus Micrarchaeota archaeon]
PTPTVIVISNILAHNISYSSANVSWLTDVPANGLVTYGTDPLLGGGGAELEPLKVISFSDLISRKSISFAGGGGGETPITMNVSHSNEITNHNLLLPGLSQFTDYYYRITSCNGATCASSDIRTFKTLPAPVIITAVNASSIAISSAVISWITSVSSNSSIQYGPTVAYGSILNNIANQYSHAFEIGPLAIGTLYHYRVASCSALGACNTSSDYTFSTQSCFDTDGGIFANVSGTVITSLGSASDYCINGIWVMENYCISSVNRSFGIQCTSCSNGACTASYCGTPDSGYTVYNSTGSFTDYCVNDILHDYHCLGTEVIETIGSDEPACLALTENLEDVGA